MSVKVLFVCLGNICRSPISQGVFEDVLRREGLEGEVEVDSAGTGSYHIGDVPDARATKSAAGRGIKLGSQRARQLALEDCDRFDYILVMDRQNYEAAAATCRGKRAELRLFMEYAPDLPDTEVPDPYFGGDGGFERAMDLAEAASEGLVEDIRRQHLGQRV